MENELDNLKFPIGKYKAILDFNFSRTVEDIKTLESFAGDLRESVKGLDKTDFKKSYRDGGMNIAQIILKGHTQSRYGEAGAGLLGQINGKSI